MRYNKDTEKLAGFLSGKISYAESHKESDLETLHELVDFIGDLIEYSPDRRDWYNLCGIIAPENCDEWQKYSVIKDTDF